MRTVGALVFATVAFIALLPGICILITAPGFTLLGEALREAMDPRTRMR